MQIADDKPFDSLTKKVVENSSSKKA